MNILGNGNGHGNGKNGGDESWKMEESTEAIFGDDTDSDDDTLRGVSNVVYRKE